MPAGAPNHSRDEEKGADWVFGLREPWTFEIDDAPKADEALPWFERSLPLGRCSSATFAYQRSTCTTCSSYLLELSRRAWVEMCVSGS